MQSFGSIAGDQITCTFTNIRKYGSIKVHTVAKEAGRVVSGLHSFTFTGQQGFSLPIY